MSIDLRGGPQFWGNRRSANLVELMRSHWIHYIYIWKHFLNCKVLSTWKVAVPQHLVSMDTYYSVVRDGTTCPLFSCFVWKGPGLPNVTSHNHMTQPGAYSSNYRFLLPLSNLAVANHWPPFGMENVPESLLLLSHGHQPHLASDATFDVTSSCPSASSFPAPNLLYDIWSFC